MVPLILQLSDLHKYCCTTPTSRTFHCFLSVFPSLPFSPPIPLTFASPSLLLSFQPRSLSSPPRCFLKSILPPFLPLDKTEKVQGVIRQSSGGGLALVRLLSHTHKHTVCHRATEVRPQGVGGHFCVCMCVWVEKDQDKYHLLYLFRLKVLMFSTSCC